MANYDHLVLRRVGEPRARRKSGRAGPPPVRDRTAHGRRLADETANLIAEFRASLPPEEIDPALVFKIRLASGISDDEWQRAGLTLLAHSDEAFVVLFSDSADLRDFRARLTAYNAGVPEGQRNTQYAGFIDAIESIEPLTPADRIGPVLKSEGLRRPDNLDPGTEYLLDVELWRPEAAFVSAFTDRIAGLADGEGGEELCRYTPEWGILMRFKGPGRMFQALLDRIEVCSIDRPPVPDMESGSVPDIGLAQVGEISAPAADAVRIGIIDSGINDGHPLLAQLVEAAFGVQGLPAGDEQGHGTAVAAIAAYGDVREMLERSAWTPRFRIVSARVVNDAGRFPDIEFAPKLVEEAIRRLHGEFGCRVINLSLADPRRPAGKRASVWTAMLDTLALELDIVVVAVTGNADSEALMAAHGNQIVDVYPEYLFEQANSILEPGNALNILTTGSIAHVNGLAAGDGIHIQSLADAREPSPFTRKGPGMRGAIKPDLVDYGGTAVYDGANQRLATGRERPGTGILSLHHRYLDRLFSSFSGTSFAAPLVAFKAASLIERFPDASASMVRALLGLSARHPEEALTRCDQHEHAEICSVLGYGFADLEAALFSDDDRVVLTAEDSLAPDQFAVYEVPVPEAFQTERGVRSISVSLAFTPPVRRSRRDYAGIGMQFDLVRGSHLQEVFQAYQAQGPDAEAPGHLQASQRCDFEPAIRLRKPGSLQVGRFEMRRNIAHYGNSYFLVVRNLGGWAREHVEAQPFAVAVMLRHAASIRLYEQIRVRLRAEGE